MPKEPPSTLGSRVVDFLIRSTILTITTIRRLSFAKLVNPMREAHLRKKMNEYLQAGLLSLPCIVWCVVCVVEQDVKQLYGAVRNITDFSAEYYIYHSEHLIALSRINHILPFGTRLQ